VRHIAVPADFIGSIHDDHTVFLRQGPGGFAQHGGFADAGFSQDENALPGLDQVFDDFNRSVDRPPDTAGEPHHFPAPVADRGDAVERALQASAVIRVEIADAVGDVLQVVLGDRFPAQFHFAGGEARAWIATKVENDLEQIVKTIFGLHCLGEFRREYCQHRLQIVRDALRCRHFLV